MDLRSGSVAKGNEDPLSKVFPGIIAPGDCKNDVEQQRQRVKFNSWSTQKITLTSHNETIYHKYTLTVRVCGGGCYQGGD